MNGSFVIARADIDRLPVIMPIMRAAFSSSYGEAWTESQCRSMLCLPGAMMFLAEAPSGPAGFAIARVVLDSAELMLLAVDPDWQGHGIGGALLGDVKSTSCSMGALALHVEVRSNNRALRFYTERGFIRIGHRSNYYRSTNGLMTDAITLSLPLG